MVRIDHFRGFSAAWEIPVDEPTAQNGEWRETPGHEFFSFLLEKFKSLPIIAEDLGYITPDVKTLMETFGFPGMKLLIFAFEGDFESNPYAPPNHIKNCIAYTGTHDCNTIRGWFDAEMSYEAHTRLDAFLGHQVSSPTVSDEMIQLVMMSPANTAILPMQDVLNLGEEGRLNYPGTPDGNWEWRLSASDLAGGLANKLSELTNKFGRG
jgi:4-alpha-glucanotransferase